MRVDVDFYPFKIPIDSECYVESFGDIVSHCRWPMVHDADDDVRFHFTFTGSVFLLFWNPFSTSDMRLKISIKKQQLICRLSAALQQSMELP
jgi:hypothetical protein